MVNSLKNHSVEEIQKTIAAALSSLSGEDLSASIHTLEFKVNNGGWNPATLALDITISPAPEKLDSLTAPWEKEGAADNA